MIWPFKRRPRPTHEILLDGVEGFFFSNKEKGRKVTVSGWTHRHWGWNDGDNVILRTRDGRAGTYRIDRVKHCGDPPDMYFVDATYIGSRAPKAGGERET